MKAGKILIVDDEKDIRQLVEEIFVEEGHEVLSAANGEQARQIWRQQLPDVIFLDVWMPDIDGISLLNEIKEDTTLSHCHVVMMSGHGTIETAIEATKLGAYDYLEKPLSLGKLLITCEHALENVFLNQENRQLKKHQPEQFLPVGKSKLISQLRETIERLGEKFTMPILVEGEKGSGKRHLARALHHSSLRKDQALIELDAEDLNQSFTQDNALPLILQLRSADKGSLMIKNIENLNDALQKIVNDLINHQQCLIGHESVHLDIRFLVLSNNLVAQKVKEGSFREDLFERLKVMTMHTPALRQHSEDIPELIEYFVSQFVANDGLGYRHFSVSAQNVLRQHAWPGNLKELQNLVQRLLILGEGEISADEVTQQLSQNQNSAGLDTKIDTSITLKQAKERLELSYLTQLLRETSGNVSETAKRSGVDRTNLYRKLKTLDIDPKNPI